MAALLIGVKVKGVWPAGVLRNRGTEVYRTLNKKSSMSAEGSMQG